MTTSQLPIIGSTALVSVNGIKKIPAKIDTGADSSAIWASNITINHQNEVEFSLFAPGSQFYTGERIVSSVFSAKSVRSSNGTSTIRYSVPLTLSIKGRRIRAYCTLADRSRNHFPILIGRRTLDRKFLVDVSRSPVPHPYPNESANLSAELVTNPRKFHQKYMSK